MLPPASTLRIEGALGPWVRTSTRGHTFGFVDARQLDIAAN